MPTKTLTQEITKPGLGPLFKQYNLLRIATVRKDLHGKWEACVG